MDELLKKIGVTVKIHRVKMKLSQAQLAKLASIDRSGLTNIESGKRNLRLGTLIKIAKSLHLKISDLV